MSKNIIFVIISWLVCPIFHSLTNTDLKIVEILFRLPVKYIFNP
jgi:hypothetical protein